jgi:hypothetical protein
MAETPEEKPETTRDPRKVSIYMKQQMLAEVKFVAEERTSSLSRIVADAWDYYKRYRGKRLKGAQLDPWDTYPEKSKPKV